MIAILEYIAILIIGWVIGIRIALWLWDKFIEKWIR